MSELIGKLKKKVSGRGGRDDFCQDEKAGEVGRKNLRGKRKNAIDKLLSREFDTVIIFENHFGFYISCFSVPSI